MLNFATLLTGVDMSAEESHGFTIRDRRGRGEDNADTPGSAAPSPKASGGAPSEASHSAATESTHDPEPHPPVTFATFIYSLGTSALMFMGEQLDPQQRRIEVNLSQAKEIIDILSMLEGKTRGNLTGEEQAVLTDMLYALRMKYVDLASAKQAPE